MGATADGQKELIAVADGHRESERHPESEQSWFGLLLDCKQRGLAIDPKLATADGALGFWAALPQVYPTTRERLRHRRAKGNDSRVACLAMVLKLCESAARTWRLLDGAKWLPDVIAGVPFINGEKAEKYAV